MVTKNRSAFYNESGSAFYNESGSGSESSPRFITYLYTGPYDRYVAVLLDLIGRTISEKEL